MVLTYRCAATTDITIKGGAKTSRFRARIAATEKARAQGLRQLEKDLARLSPERGSPCDNSPVTITLRGAFIFVFAVALCLGLYLLWLWRPEHQVRLHTEHFFHAIDGRNWETVAHFIGEDYRDQWDHDRARLLERMREGFRWVRGSRITAPDVAVRVRKRRAMWIGKINIYSSDDGVMQLLDERVNRLPTPFELEWHHVSGKPWDWKLVCVSNSAFQVPADAY